MDIDELQQTAERVKRHAQSVLPKSRWEHSVRVAETAALLCKRYGVDELRGYFAGIAHDMCKNMTDDGLIALALRDGNELSALEKAKPSLLHGRAAAVQLASDFGVRDEHILEAVRCHTFGKSGMCTLAKIIYVADKIEPGRAHMTATYFNKLLLLELDELIKTVLEENIAYLAKKGCELAVDTRAFLASLKR